MTAICLIILVLATVGQAGTFANCVNGHLFALMDDPTQFMTDLSIVLHTPMSNSAAEDLVTAIAAMDCSAVDAVLPTTSLNSAEWTDFLHVAVMEEIHSAVPATQNRRELLVVATGVLVGTSVLFAGATIYIELTRDAVMSAGFASSVSENLIHFLADMTAQGVDLTDSIIHDYIDALSYGRRALSTEGTHVIITSGDMMAGCAKVGQLSDVCMLPIGDLSVDFSTALCGGPSESLECDLSFATLIGVIDEAQAPQSKGMDTETSLALKNDRLRRTNRALVKRFKELSMN